MEIIRSDRECLSKEEMIGNYPRGVFGHGRSSARHILDGGG